LVKSVLRRLRGALGNALVWGSAWFLAAFPLTAVFWVLGLMAGVPIWPFALGTAQTLAGMGFVAGGAFSLFLGIAGRHKRLKDLGPTRIALGTGVVTGVIVPALGAVVNAFGGYPVTVEPAVMVWMISGGLAGVSALGTIKAAQSALAPGEEGHGALESGPAQLLAGPERDPVWQGTLPFRQLR
jgi:hypothetical protein